MVPLEVCLDTDNSRHLRANLTLLKSLNVSRIELCSAMSQQGLTPTAEDIKLARELLNSEQTLLVMVRPRAGSFHYTDSELKLMQKQIVMAADSGADGVVLGALNSRQSEIDWFGVEPLRRCCADQGMSITFHRAFDALDNKELALCQLLEWQFDRVLSTGGSWFQPGTALDGLFQLKHLLNKVNGQLELVVAGGINASLAVPIVQALSAVGHIFSLHTYSGVLRGAELDKTKLWELLEVCQYRGYSTSAG